MTNRFTSIAIAFAFCLTLVAGVFGQEQNGNIEGTVKDSTGAVVPNVSVTVSAAETSASTGFKRTVTTGNDGFFRLVQVPPGIYTVATEAVSGFASARYENVQVVLGKTTQLEIAVTPGGTETIVDVAAGDQPVDTTSSEISTSITSQKIDLLPKGVDFTSVLKTVPGTRPEPKSGGFTVDGASGAENSFIIDGQEVTNYRNAGLNGNNAVPFSIVQEVQVKSSGFNAEFGGATGGVINVVTKGGNNDFHGDLGVEFQPSKLQGGNRPVLDRFGTSSQVVEYRTVPKSQYVNFFPNATFSGPIIKDRAWFFVNHSPQVYESTVDTVFYTNAPLATRTVTGREKFHATRTYNYSFARIDAQPWSKLRLTGTYLWNPIVDDGVLPFGTESYSTLESTFVNFGGDIGRIGGAELARRQGGRQNSNNITGQAVYTVTNNIIASFRYSRGFLNEKLGNYFKPSGLRYICWFGNRPGADFGPDACTENVNDPANDQTVKDVSVRTNYEGDVSFLFNAGGRHELKAGYQHQSIFNDLQKNYTERVYLQYGTPITQDFNFSTAATPSAPMCQPGQTSGCVLGHGVLYRYGELGSGSNLNQALYIQDKWQPFRRLTLNLGVRIEKEDLPSFNEFAAPFGFDWSDKIAPRLGASYDLFGDGRTKLFASYGKFYDRLKFKMAQGSFGGNFYRVDFFEIFPDSGPYRTAFTTETILGNYNDAPGGSCPTTGFIGSGLSRCQNDYRVASNDPNADPFESGAIDTNLRPYSQREFTVGFAHELNRDYVFRARYTDKKLLDAVEDAGVISASGSEIYITGNPGEGLHAEFLREYGYNEPFAKPERQYNGLEVVLERRLSNNYYFNLNYTLSRLYGNYSGLANSDENGRSDPGVNRSFDLPFIGYTAKGQLDNGRLATDRPHVFNAYGAYIWDWFGSNSNQTEIGAFQSIMSGTPQTSTVGFITTTIFLERGDLGRTPTLSQTDLNLTHRYKFGRDDRFGLVFNLNILNLWNQDTTTSLFTSKSIGTIGRSTLQKPNPNYDPSLPTGPSNPLTVARYSNYRDLINDYNAGLVLPYINEYLDAAQSRRDNRYGMPSEFQGPRSVRFGFRFQF